MNRPPMPYAGSFPAERMDRAEAVLRRGIEAGVFPGCSACVGIGADVAWRKGLGKLDPDSPHPVAPETAYDLASLTKPLACASSIMLLLERGEICATDEARRFFPDSPLPQLRGVTIAHLLTHTSGLPAWDKLYDRCSGWDETVSAILATALDARPGDRYLYSDLGYILLGEIVRRVSGKRLDDFARIEVFESLGMRSTGYWILAEGDRRFTGSSANIVQDAERLTAPTRNCPLREGRRLYAEVHDANACGMGGVSGHAGLFGTAEDVSVYLRMLMSDGRRLDGEPFFSPATVRAVTRSQIPELVGGQSFGWFTPPNGMHVGGDLWGRSGFSHSGFTGTSAFADPASGVWVVLLTNAVYFSTGEHLRIRRAFHNAVAGAFAPPPERRAAADG